MPEKVALLVIHGIGQQKPYEALDHFARGLYSSFTDDPNAPKWTVEPEMEACEDPAHLQKTWTRVSYRLIPDRPVCFRSDCPNQLSDITLYEYYWAPLTQDKVSYLGSLTFLIKAGLQPFFYLASNINAIWKSEDTRRSRWTGLAGVVAREFWRLAALFLPIILLLTGLLVGLYKVLNGELSGVLKNLHGAMIVLLVFLFIRYLYIFTTIGALREAAAARDGWQTQWLWKGTLLVLLLAHVFAWPLLASHVLGLAAMFGHWLAPTKLGVWLSGHHLVAGLTKAASESVFPLKTGGLSKNLVRFFLLSEHLARQILLPMVWLLLAYLVKYILIDYVGDIAVYANAQELAKNFAARAQILDECTNSLAAILKKRRNTEGLTQEPFFDRVIVVGHSLGSVIAYDTINALQNRARTADTAKTSDFQPEDLLNLCGMVTFGCPLNKFFYFFRDKIGPRQTLRSQTLDLLHGFRVRGAINDFALPLFTTVTDERWREAADCLNFGFRWINAYSPEDPISGKLLFYDLQQSSNQRLFLYKWPFLAHVSYWEDSNFYDWIRSRIL